MKKFVIVTKDFSGVGFAKMLKADGCDAIVAFKSDDIEKLEAKDPADLDDEEKEEVAAYHKVGRGEVSCYPLDRVMEKRHSMKDAYWIFDMNYLSSYSEKLRKEGFRVLGASKITEKMEDDREFGAKLAKESGLQIPETRSFKNIPDGLKFLDEELKKGGSAWCFKPDADDRSYMTYVPTAKTCDGAIKELHDYMSSLSDVGEYILQEKKFGVEANFEVWLYDGAPFFAFCNLENKRKLNGDVGENVGCAQDIGFTVALNCKGVRETVGKLVPRFKDVKGLMFLDVNVIISDREVYFLEFCARFGYNAHPNLFINLANDKVSDLLADALDGKVKDFDKRWKFGFGASVSLYMDHKHPGFPLFVSEEVSDKFYCFESYKKDGKLYLAGYDHAVGILCAHDYTIEDAAEKLVEILKARKVNYPDMAFRSDLQEEDYDNSPIRRYAALQAMHYV